MKRYLYILLLLTASIAMGQNRQAVEDHYTHEAKTLAEFIRHSQENIPDTSIDVTFYYLDLSIATDNPYIEGVVTCQFTPLIEDLDQIWLSLNSSLNVDDITGHVSSYYQIGDSILINLDDVYNPGDELEAVISYSGIPVEAGGYKGLRYETHHGTEPIIATLSTPYLAHYWYPCKDGPSDKPDSVYIDITIPVQTVNGVEVMAVSNGILENVIDNTTEKTYQWRHRYPVVTYYVMVAISNFVEFGEEYTGIYGEQYDLDYYVFQQDLASSQAGVVDMPLALDIFSEKFGEYPFSNEKYGMTQLGFYGAIENQTNTITNNMFPSWFMVSVHELGHMWFGDNITCENWHHAWLNEGFASYSEAIYVDEADGFAAYQQYMEGFEYYNGGTLYLENAGDTFNIFQGIIYRKGAYALHMLRGVMGDSLFFESIYDYATHPDFMYAQAVTEDFQAVCEDVYGDELGFFFDQWIYDEYYPSYRFNFQNQGDELVFAIQQVQGNAGRRPVFEMPVELSFMFDGSGDTTIRVWNDEEYQVFSIPASDDALIMSLDPNNWILCQKTFDPQLPVGLAEAESSQFSVEIYPNPVVSSAKIEINTNSHDPLELTIHNINGQKVVNLENLSGGVHTLNRGTLPAGIYLYSLQFQSGNFLKTGKLILK